MKFAITGAAGMLGTDTTQTLQRLGHDVVAWTRHDLDATDGTAAHAMITAIAPDVVVNCAAFTAVDACETDRSSAFAGNETAARNVAAACLASRSRLIHISTDYVFDGTKIEPYTETDPTNPLSVYGESKLAGETAVLETLGPDATVIRTSWLCGQHGPNMVNTVLRLVDATGPLRFVSDQRGCPTFSADLAETIELLATTQAAGIFHVTNQGAVSWYEFVAEIVAQAGGDVSRVEPIPTSALQPPRPAPRPRNSVLDNAAMRSAGLPMLDDYRLALSRLIATLQ